MTTGLDIDVADCFEDAPCGYLIAQPDRRIVTVNAALEAMLGMPRKELVGKPFTDLFTAGGRIHYETHFDPILRLHGQLSGITMDLVTAEGERLPVFLAANAKVDEAGDQASLPGTGVRAGFWLPTFHYTAQRTSGSHSRQSRSLRGTGTSRPVYYAGA